VASRRVFLRRGLAYVAKDQIASLVVAHFRARLAKVPHAYIKLLVFRSDAFLSLCQAVRHRINCLWQFSD